jgi:formylglycine-generating enzyme required for sulfatase activity
VTNRFFGDSDELLVGYGWYVPNSDGQIHPCGRLRPNDFGIFDGLGNVWNWCHDRFHEYRDTPNGEPVVDQEPIVEGINAVHMLRGGCYTDHATGLRSAHRWAAHATNKTNIIGFRVARTIATTKGR